MRRKSKAGVWLPACACALLLAVGLAAQQPEPRQDPQQDPMFGEVAPPPEQQPVDAEQALGERAQLLSKLHQTNQVEIQAGELARERGTSRGVRNFGDRIARDHEFADRHVRTLAERLNLPLASVESAAEQADEALREQQAGLQELQGLEGEAFDRRFVEFMDRTHAQALALLDEVRLLHAPEAMRDPVVNLAESLRPILEQHHQLADHVRHRHMAEGR